MAADLRDERCPTCGRSYLVNHDHLPTRQQVRVLRLCAAGLTPMEVAAELWLSVETVRWHLKTAYRRLGVHDRADAIARAIELGLITPANPAPEGLA